MAHSSRVLRGTIWLLAAGILAKILGAVFRIPLTSMLGGTGMGYYSSAYGLFLPVFALSVTGINTAVAALTAQYLAKGESASAHRLYVLALRSFAMIGTAASAGLFLLAKPLCTHLLRNPHAALSVQCFAPAVLICCLSAVLRGRFEGHQRMEPTAVSQIAEGFARVGFGLSLCAFAMHHTAGILPFLPPDIGSDALAAAAAILGVTLSALTGLVTACFFRIPKSTDSAPCSTDRQILRAFFRLLIPVTIASLVTNLTGLLDLAAGLPVLAAALHSEEQANFCFGAYSGLAVTMFNLVPSVTNTLGKGVLPAFAESCTKKDRAAAARHAEDVLWRTAFLACPAGLGLAVLAKPILELLFSSRPQEIMLAAPALQILGIAVIFTSLSFPLFSMMQGAGFGSEPVKVMLIGAAVKFPCNLFLIPRIGLSGAAWATLLCYFVILLAGVRRFRKCTGLPCPILRSAAKPLFAGVLCAAMACLLISHTALPFAVMGSGAVYLLAMFLLH
ncbi:MAG: polysaccharide biosynthesis protein [Oscillospiraceae bacterium]|nr:polysaccharide biosynthesis protein [Oscillospiraceae bacterium]